MRKSFVSKQWWVGQLLLLALVVLATYSNIWDNQFVWDDHGFVLGWPETRQFWNHLPELLKGAVPLEHQGLYRPFRSILYGLAYTWWGTNLLGYHVLSVVIHISGTWLQYALLRKLLPSKSWLPLICALIFAVHPVHVEAITWITPNFDIIGVLWAAAAIYAYISFRQTGRKLWLGFAICWATLAYFTNEITLVTAGIIGSYDLLLYRPPKNLKALFNLGKYWLLVFIPALIYIYIRFIVLDIGARQEPLFGSYLTGSLVMSFAAVKQMWLLIFPYPLTVNHTLFPGINALFYHERNLLVLPPRPRLFDLRVLGSLFILGTIARLGWKYRRQYPLAVWWLTWHALAVLPLMQLVPQSVIFGERYLYFASFGSIPLLVWLIDQGLNTYWPNNWVKYKYLVFVPIVVIYAGISYQRNLDWRTDQTLWEATLAVGPETSYGLNNLAKHYYEAGDTNTALDLLERSYELNPNELIAVSNLGVLYNRLDRLDEALALHEHVYQLSPTYSPNYEKYASALLKSGQHDKAYEFYAKYMEAFPNNPTAHLKLAQAFHNSFQYSSAAIEYEQIIDKFPQYFEAHYYLTRLYLDMGDPEAAQAQLDQTRILVEQDYHIDIDLSEFETDLEALWEIREEKSEGSSQD